MAGVAVYRCAVENARMTRHIALLRGINVGTAKRIAMADLRALMAALGFSGVRTLLNSGNAVFDARGGSAASHARRLQAAILQQAGIDCEVIVKTAAELAAAIAEHPLRRQADDDSRLLVMFTQDAATLASLEALQGEDWAPEAFAVGRHAAWLWCAEGVIASRISKATGKLLGQRGTARNWATVEKLQALVDTEPA
jgi:uncharacterized protein (DUF1697 family)